MKKVQLVQSETPPSLEDGWDRLQQRLQLQLHLHTGPLISLACNQNANDAKRLAEGFYKWFGLFLVFENSGGICLRKLFQFKRNLDGFVM